MLWLSKAGRIPFWEAMFFVGNVVWLEDSFILVNTFDQVDLNRGVLFSDELHMWVVVIQIAVMMNHVDQYFHLPQKVLSLPLFNFLILARFLDETITSIASLVQNGRQKGSANSYLGMGTRMTNTMLMHHKCNTFLLSPFVVHTFIVALK
ncbi:hypothetical protein Lal_00025409 [Lupinus albus]|nr:hypothetical protein Lal_00025409 [Lupinus albus]